QRLAERILDVHQLADRRDADDRNRGEPRIFFLQVPKVPALHVGQHEIEHDQLRTRLLAEPVEGVGHRPDRGHGIPAILEDVHQRSPRPGIVFDDQDVDRRSTAVGGVGPRRTSAPRRTVVSRLSSVGHRRPVSSRGSDTENVDPAPGALSSVSCPPIARTVSRAIHKPRPKPPYSRRGTARENRVNSCCCRSRSMPMPRSATTMRTVSASAATVTRIGLRSPNLIALETRLVTICSSRSRSDRPPTRAMSTASWPSTNCCRNRCSTLRTTLP